MFSNSIIVRDFLDNFDLLSSMQEGINHEYEFIQNHLNLQKKTNVYLIGNPVLKLQSNLVELNYSLKLHVLNCKVYESLIYDNVEIDDMLKLQIRGLQETTYELGQKYIAIKDRYQTLTQANTLAVS